MIRECRHFPKFCGFFAGFLSGLFLVVLGMEFRLKINDQKIARTSTALDARVSLLENELDRFTADFYEISGDRWRRTDFGNYIRRVNSEMGTDFPIPESPE